MVMPVELTAREMLICEHLLKGKCYKEIALELGLSYNYLNTRITKLYHKLDATNKSSLLEKLRKV